MKAYSITYDLKTPNANYKALYEEIQSLGAWWHYLESTWIVSTNYSSEDIWNKLSKLLTQDDHMLIIEVKRDCYGWLPQEAWDWITENINS